MSVVLGYDESPGARHALTVAISVATRYDEPLVLVYGSAPPGGAGEEIAAHRAALEEQGIGADVVSMPSTDRFDATDDAYREDILPDVSNKQILRVSIEAGITHGWERYTGLHGLRIGLDRFGASAPAPDLYKKFGLTKEAILPKILEHLRK